MVLLSEPNLWIMVLPHEGKIDIKVRDTLRSIFSSVNLSTVEVHWCLFQLLEFQEAVEHREGIISQLSSSLQQAIVTRDALQVQGDQLAQEVAVLQHQLKATTELIQGHHWDTGIKPHDYVTLQNRVSVHHLLLTHTQTHACSYCWAWITLLVYV